jgi:ABC-type nitrate/sulfonate/bicarbonate transport system substrate-binding protein
MGRRFVALAFATALGLGFVARAEEADPKDAALSWQKQATDTRATVAGVAEELGRIGDKGNAAAKGMIDDAVHWIDEGDKSRAKGDEKMSKEEYKAASLDYNMAWQHYVRAATSGLNAKRMLTGE